MTPQQLIGLGVRLFSVWLAVSSIRYFSSVPMYMLSMNEEPQRLYQTFGFGVAHIIAAVLLWVFPLTVAHKIVPRTQFTDTIQAQFQTIAHVGCALLGLWLLAKSLPSLFGNALSLLLHRATVLDMEIHMQVEIGVVVFEVMLALFLIFKATLFSTLVAHSHQ